MTESKENVANGATKGTEQQPKEQQTDLLEADDLFEEFGNAEWHSAKDDEAVPLWEADWEDENLADDFAGRLRAELDQRGME